MVTKVAPKLKRKIAGRKVKLVPLAMCFPDPLVQRGKKYNHIQQMLNEFFDPKAVRNIVVSKRKDGRYSILDGQHRWHTLLEQGYTHVYAEVHEGLTIQEEAYLFEKLNRQKAVTKMDIFRGKMIEPKSQESAIFGMVERHGWRLKVNDKDKHDNLITSIGAFQNAWKAGGQYHTSNFLTCLAAFNDNGILQEKARSNRFLEALQQAVQLETNKGRSADELASCLRGKRADAILREAQQLAGGNGFKEIEKARQQLTIYFNSVPAKLRIAA